VSLDIRYGLPGALILFLCLGAFTPLPAPAGPAPVIEVRDEPDEVYLTFRYRGVLDAIITCLHLDGRFYLPLTSLFRALAINQETDARTLAVHGEYQPTGEQYRIDFDEGTATIGGRPIRFTADDFIVGEADYYLATELVLEIFDLDFEVDVSRLVLLLRAERSLPIYEIVERRRRRERMARYNPVQTHYPLIAPMGRAAVDGLFLDYTLTSSGRQVDDQALGANLALGGHVLGGALSLNALGSHRNEYSDMRLTGGQWRFGLVDNPVLTGIAAGSVSAEGFTNRSLWGVQVSNHPLEPVRLFVSQIVEGEADPNSEVEIYLNNVLVDWARVDDSGRYRFEIPLPYGSAQIRTVVGTPGGLFIERLHRVQVPHAFVRPGKLRYSITAGRQRFVPAGEQNLPVGVAARVDYGVSSRLTARVGVDHFTRDEGVRTAPFTALSARIGHAQLATIEFAPGTLVRTRLTGIFSSGISWSGTGAHFLDPDFAGASGRTNELQGDLYIPARIGRLQGSLRVDASRLEARDLVSTRASVDLGVQIRRLSLRTGYRGNWFERPESPLRLDQRVSYTASYSFPYLRTRSSLVAGLFVRGQVEVGALDHAFRRVDLSMSRPVTRRGRVNLTYSYDHLLNMTAVRGGFTLDLNEVRVASTATRNRNAWTFNQSVRGSAGLDLRTGHMNLTHRQQVGRGAATVRLFLDRNNSGTFDEGDEIITDNAVRLRRSGFRYQDRSGVTRLLQLQPYARYDVEINPGALSNPMFVPGVDKFSFIASPNVFNTVDVPFYMSGILDGAVMRRVGETLQPIGGVRLFLRSDDGESEHVMQTFSDGGFYVMGVRPGHYTLEIDPGQLPFLRGTPKPASMEVVVEPLYEGAFIEGLNFVVEPDSPDDGGMDRAVDVPPVEDEEELSEAIPPDLPDVVEADRPLITGPGRWALRLGAFHEPVNAVRRADDARRRFGFDTIVRYDHEERLLHVLGAPYASLQEARRIRQEIRTDPAYRDVFVAEYLEVPADDAPYFVEVAAFESVDELLESLSKAGHTVLRSVVLRYAAAPGPVILVDTPPRETPRDALESVEETLFDHFPQARLLVRVNERP
jgi:hypothetical protein